MTEPPVPARRLLRPRWGVQTSIFQFRQPALYLYAVLLALTLWFHAYLQALFAGISGTGLALSWALLLVYALPLFLLIYALDLYEREPPSLLAGALLWGAVVATGLSVFANQGWGAVVTLAFGPTFASEWGAAVVAPVTEEILKAVGVVVLYLIARGEMDDVMDGFVYGAMVGLGFAVVEDVLYFMAVFGGTVPAVLTGFYIRVLASGLYSHVLYTALTGMGVAFVVSRRDLRPTARLLVAGGLFAVAMFGHFLWNSPLLNFFPEYPWTGREWVLIPLATAVKGVPFLLFVVLMLRLAHRREQRWLDAALATEVGTAGILSGELEILSDPARRRSARRELRRRSGSGAARLLRRLHREQISLAMVRTRVDDDEHPDLLRQRERCERLRRSLATLSDAATPPPPADPD